MTDTARLTVLLAKAAAEINTRAKVIAAEHISPEAFTELVTSLAERFGVTLDDEDINHGYAEFKPGADDEISNFIVAELERAMNFVHLEQAAHKNSLKSLAEFAEPMFTQIVESDSEIPEVKTFHDATKKIIGESYQDVIRAFDDLHHLRLKSLFLGCGVSETTALELAELLAVSGPT